MEREELDQLLINTQIYPFLQFQKKLNSKYQNSFRNSSAGVSHLFRVDGILPKSKIDPLLGKVTELTLWIDHQTFDEFKEILPLLETLNFLQVLRIGGTSEIISDLLSKYGMVWATLKELFIEVSDSLILPENFGINWSNLEVLCIRASSFSKRFLSVRTVSIPNHLRPMPSLRTFEIQDLTNISQNLGIACPNLTDLRIKGTTQLDPQVGQHILTTVADVVHPAPITGITSLPKSFSNLTQLSTLHLENTNLSSLPDIFDSFESLSEVVFSTNPHLHFLPTSFGQCHNLRELTILHCPISEIPPFDPPIQVIGLHLPGTQIHMLPRGMSISPEYTYYNKGDQLRYIPSGSLYGFTAEALWENNLGTPGCDDYEHDPVIHYLLQKYAKHVSELAQLAANHPTDLHILTADEWDRLGQEAGHRERAILEPHFPPDHPVMKTISNRLQFPSPTPATLRGADTDHDSLLL